MNNSREDRRTTKVAKAPGEFNDDIGEPGTQVLWVRVEECYPDPRYQRPITDQGQRRINKFAAEFKWSKFSVLDSGPRTPKGYPIKDGQHRLEAARLHPKVDKVPIWITGHDEVGEQANDFVGINRDRTQVSPINIFWAALAAGEERATWIKQRCDAAGVTIAKANMAQLPPLTTSALSSFDRLRKLVTDQDIDEGLKALAEALPTQYNVFLNPVIEAVCRFVHLYRKSGYRYDRLVQVLARMNLKAERLAAKRFRMDYNLASEELALRYMILRNYNKGLGADSRLPDGFGG